MQRATIREIVKAKHLGGNEYRWLFFLSLSDKENDIAYFSHDQKEYDFIYSLRPGDIVDYETAKGKKNGEYFRKLILVEKGSGSGFENVSDASSMKETQSTITEKDRFIAKQAVFKGLCEVSKRGTPVEEIIKSTKLVMEELF